MIINALVSTDWRSVSETGQRVYGSAFFQQHFLPGEVIAGVDDSE
jgi:hypothetical protein